MSGASVRASALLLALHVHAPPARLPVPASVRGRLHRCAPLSIEVYLPHTVRQDIDDDCRFVEISWPTADDARKSAHAHAHSPPAPTPADGAPSANYSAAQSIIATVSALPPPYLDASIVSAGGLVVVPSSISRHIFLHRAPAQVSVRPLPAHAIRMWSSLRIRVLPRCPPQLLAVPPALHPLFPISAAAGASAILAARPPIEQIHMQLLDRPVWAGEANGIGADGTGRELLLLLLDDQYHAVELSHGEYPAAYGPSADDPLTGWGMVTSRTQVKWCEEGDANGGAASPSSAVASASLLQLSIPSLFARHLQSFEDEEDEEPAQSELKAMALLIKMFATERDHSETTSPAATAANPASLLLSPRSLLLSGPSGTGKFTFLQSIARLFGLRLDVISLGRLLTRQGVTGQADALRKILVEVRDRARTHKSLLVVRELELMFAVAHADQRDEETQELQAVWDGFVAEVESTASSASSSSANLLIVGVTSSKNLLAANVSHSFQYRFKMLAPSNEGRRRILQAHLQGMGGAPTTTGPFDTASLALAWVVEQTQGYVGADLVGLIKAAVGIAGRERRNSDRKDQAAATQLLQLTSEHFRLAMERVRPAALKALHVVVKAKTDAPPPATAAPAVSDAKAEAANAATASTATSSPVVSSPTFSTIGGLSSVKLRLRELLLWPLLHSRRFASLGIRPTRGILLYGVPGVGKTMLARMVAKEFQASFLVLNLPDLLRAGVGESERRISELFARAKKVAPAIIFLDEVQAVFGKGGGNGLQGKMMAQLLYQIDGLAGSRTTSGAGVDAAASASNKQVLILAATNLPSAISPSLLRAGRLDQVLYVGPPDEEARAAILRLSRKTANWSASVTCEEGIREIVRRTEGFSGVDMVHLVARAGLCALERAPEDVKEVRLEDFSRAFESITSSITPAMIAACESWGKKFAQRYARSKQRMKIDREVEADGVH